MEKRTLKGHPYMQAKVWISDNGTTEILESYSTSVVFKRGGEVAKEMFDGFSLNVKEYYECTGLFSRTTIKHISLYCRENDISYCVLKLIAGTSWAYLIAENANPYKLYFYNFNSGEVLEITNNDLLHHYKKIKNYIDKND